MTLENIIIGIGLFLVGIIGHEYMHVVQLKMRGIESYWIDWLPGKTWGRWHWLPRVAFMYDLEDPKQISSEYVELIPACFTAFMWLLALAYFTT